MASGWFDDMQRIESVIREIASSDEATGSVQTTIQALVHRLLPILLPSASLQGLCYHPLSAMVGCIS